MTIRYIIIVEKRLKQAIKGTTDEEIEKISENITEKITPRIKADALSSDQ